MFTTEFKILQGESSVIVPMGTHNNFCAIWLATSGTITGDSIMSFEMECPKLGGYLPLVNNDGESAGLIVTPNSVVCLNPFTDFRGSSSVRFKFSVVQENDVRFELGFVTM